MNPTNPTLPGPVTSTRRIDPCGCGCCGGDPWHQREFVRTLRDVRVAAGTAKVHAYSEPSRYRAVALARLPWGEGRMVRVVELVISDTDGREHSLGWFSTAEIVA